MVIRVDHIGVKQNRDDPTIIRKGEAVREPGLSMLQEAGDVVWWCAWTLIY